MLGAMPFELTEYERAFVAFLSQATDALVDEDPVLGQIKRVKTSGPLASKLESEPGPPTEPPSEDKAVVLDAQLIQVEHEHDVPALMNGDAESLQAAIAAGADSVIQQQKTILYEHVELLGARAGRRVQARGRDLAQPRMDSHQQTGES